ncbi:unnamed protein product [Didymodactylos carnosus]|uniref:NAD(P)(+)--arginine ADP-ribosyltransferase n=1 Tax=Didymodactylos carnosus TaxID=1234261 RepID=A0A8S2G4I5_9BILA|nr:unnamed protein product [Didymodactylos carnosus]CAF4452084.1 unnamed protein product [Didymodactylos carnosus]
MNVLESEQFCGKNGSRTIFSIECLNGKSITQHSYYKTEDEILLLPAIYFKVHSQFDAGNGLYIIQLKEIKPPCVLLPPADKIPTWKQFNSGICLEGTCKNCGCEAYNQTVIMPIGFRRFDLLTDVNEVTTKCPVCTSYVEVERCAFNNCLWRWEGPSSSVSDWKRADNYIHFEQELNEHVRWRKLVLEAKAITT